MKILTMNQMIKYMHTLGIQHSEKRGPKREKYMDAICAFDIETYTLQDPSLEDKQAVMYCWQFAANDKCCLCRTWDQYITFIDSLSDLPATVVIYVFNLSFEFQWLSGIFNFKTDNVFCTAARKILRAKYNNIEYRCAMLLSNDSLAGFCEQFKVEHRKQSGETFHYEKERYYFTPLTLFEYKYALYDVIGLVECLQAKMKVENKDLYTIPLTATGFVRQDVKIILKPFNKYKQRFLQPESPKMYIRQKEMFRGGNVHSNRYFTNMVLNENGFAIDISSSYPTQMCTKPMPMSGWRETKPTYNNYVDLKKRGYTCMMVVSFFGLYLKDKYDGFPPLSRSKCRNVYKEIIDNGRILSAIYLETTLTDIDFEIILDHYDGDLQFKELYYCRSELLPVELRNYIRQLYVDKTTLKGVSGEYAETRYMQAKNRINAIYGLSVQDNLKALIQYVNGDYYPDPNETLEQRIQKNLRSAYMSFSWGCFITAFARQQLEMGLKAFNKNGFAIYCDTDSVFGIGDCDLDALNKPLIKQAEKYDLKATDNKGNVHKMGIFEIDKTWDSIRLMGAKKYAWVKDGVLKCTIAGVNKKKGAQQLAAAGGLQAMNEGFIFQNVNSNAIYNDTIDTTIIRQGKPVHITKNVAIEESDYTLGLTGDYEYILTHPESFYDL